MSDDKNNLMAGFVDSRNAIIYFCYVKWKNILEL